MFSFFAREEASAVLLIPQDETMRFHQELTIWRNPTAENCGAFLMAWIKFLCASEYSSCLAFIIPVKKKTRTLQTCIQKITHKNRSSIIKARLHLQFLLRI